ARASDAPRLARCVAEEPERPALAALSAASRAGGGGRYSPVHAPNRNLRGRVTWGGSRLGCTRNRNGETLRFGAVPRGSRAPPSCGSREAACIERHRVANPEML